MKPICVGLALTFSLFVLAHAAPPEPTNLDKAIDRGLQYLALSQSSDGAWRAGSSRSPAVTALAVMAFLSAGHVPGEGPHAEAVEKGIRWVLKQQAPNGLIATDAGHEMYHHGICTLMLAEVAGMCEPPLSDEVRRSLERAVAVILKAQRPISPKTSHSGGWRYRVNATDADISVTGWQLMALRAAKNLGCDVPAERIEWAVDYLKRCQDPVSGGFSYQADARAPNTARTGTGVLGLEICGKQLHRSPECLKGGHYLQDKPVGADGYFYYSIYYCSQAMFQLGGNQWTAYRPKLHDAVLRNQGPRGSWDYRAGDGHGADYGTAMAILALTVEYRFLPIYQRAEEPAETSAAGKN